MAILLLIGWVLVVFAWPHPGQVKHTLLALAVISLIFGLTRKKSNDI
jgi:hypothetical protein